MKVKIEKNVLFNTGSQSRLLKQGEVHEMPDDHGRLLIKGAHAVAHTEPAKVPATPPARGAASKPKPGEESKPKPFMTTSDQAPWGEESKQGTGETGKPGAKPKNEEASGA